MKLYLCWILTLYIHFFCRSKRAAYKYAKDRGAVASRWCWLATQISELDYKIRQHTDLRKHIRDNKGVVALEEVAGFEGQLPGSKTKESDDDGDGLAARVRPFVKASFRKRKIVLTANLHHVAKKASRPR
jgi:KAT8 regulatory NSL complex subunit 1